MSDTDCSPTDAENDELDDLDRFIAEHWSDPNFVKAYREAQERNRE